MAALQSENNLSEVDSREAAIANLLPSLDERHGGTITFWNGGKWDVLLPPDVAGVHLLTITGGVPRWVPLP